MARDDIENLFDPELRRIARAATLSSHPATKHLMDNVGRFAEIFAYDANLHSKLSRTDRSISLGIAESGSLQGNEIWIPVDLLTNHLLLVGSSGSGKSTAYLNLVLQLKKLGIACWIFDRKGGLLPLAAHAGFLYVKPMDFPLNLLRPPQNVEGYSSIVSAGFAAALELGSVGQLLMTQILSALHQKTTSSDPRKQAPSLYELYNTFSSAIRERSYKEQAEVHPLVRDASRVGGIMLGNLGRGSSYYNGVPTESLMARDVYFDCRGLSTDEAHLFIGMVNAGTNARKFQNGEFSGRLERFNVFDDLDEVVFRKPGVSNIDLFGDMHSKVRAIGIGEGFSSHTWIGMNQPRIQSDTWLYALTRLNNAVDSAAMIRAMAGGTSLLQEVLTLEPGRMLIKIAGTEEPFLVRVSMPEIAMNVLPEQLNEAEARTKEFIEQFDLYPVPEETQRLVQSQILRDKNSPRTVELVIDQKEKLREERVKEAALMISQSPGITASILKGKLKWASSNEMFNEIIEEGLNQNVLLAVKRYFEKGERGRPAMRFGLTSKGYEMIGKHAEGEGKGHIQRIFLTFVKDSLTNQGLKVRGEQFDRRADLYALRPDGSLQIAIEICVTTPTDQTNREIHRLLEEEKVPAILVIVVHLTEEPGKKNVYVLNRKSEESKTDALRRAVRAEFGDESMVAVKSFEEFRYEK